MQSSSRTPDRSRVRSRRSVVALISTAVAGFSLILGISGAFANVAPGKYGGHTLFHGAQTSFTVTFKVASGKVKKLTVGPFLPSRCGSGGPVPKKTSKTVPVRNNKFAGTVKEISTDGKAFGTAKVKGKFQAGGKVKGTVKTTFPAPAANCGVTETFLAKKH